MNRQEICQQLTKNISELIHSGAEINAIPNVHLLYGTQPRSRGPVLYEPGIVFLFSGHKTGYLNRRVFHYNASEYLLLTVPLPFECETTATPEAPLAGMRINIDINVLQSLIIEIGDDKNFNPEASGDGINSGLLSEDILCALERLIQAMRHPLNAKILGQQTIREILYYILIGPCGGALLALVSRLTHFSQISKVIRQIESRYTQSLTVEQLAGEANMSVSAFHHNFKSVTSTSPLQYLKSYRLHKARLFMIHDGMKASAAAIRVGYESASQFSREFKRYFGVTPGEESAKAQV